ncbi:hypothetical protein KRR40_46975 [Niabella defluvii]|nr:hypothetical protein KRR40_46975 [Niabella sp. I65]
MLFMLIYYSIAAYELLEHRLSDAEKEEVYDVFYRVGIRMDLKDLPSSYVEWLPVREAHLSDNLQKVTTPKTFSFNTGNTWVLCGSRYCSKARSW